MRIVLRAVLLSTLIGGAYLAGVRSRLPHVARKTDGAVRKVVYVDPMHPSYRSDRPGTAPDCGMVLTPRYVDELPASASQPMLPSGAVRLSLEQQQLIGVRLLTVKTSAVRYALRALGRVVADETKDYRVNAASDGIVQDVRPLTASSVVQKDALLATFRPPEFLSAVRAYLLSLASEEAAKSTMASASSPYFESYRLALRSLGMSERQIDDISRTRRMPDAVEIRAPARGMIVSRTVSPGQTIEKGELLYHVADLSHVWILVDVTGSEASAFPPGATVTVSAPAARRTFRARVTNALPIFEPATQRFQIRLQADNKPYLLRPDMWVDVEHPVQRPAAVVVPGDAIVDSGLRTLVYVTRGDGVFEARTIETGWRHGDQVEVVSGLSDGEVIAVAGTFLLDSESRLRARDRIQ